MEIVYFLVIGAVVGWLAGQIVKGRGFGLLGNMVVGVVGAVLGGFLFRQLGLGSGDGLLGVLLVSLVGAIVLLAIVSVVKKA